MQTTLFGIIVTHCMSLLMQKYFALFSTVLEILKQKAVGVYRNPISYIKLAKISVSIQQKIATFPTYEKGITENVVTYK